MTNGVAHDDPYTEYQTELQKIDMLWTVPGWLFYATAAPSIARLLLPVPWWVAMTALLLLVVVLTVTVCRANHLDRLIKEVGEKYVSQLLTPEEQEYISHESESEVGGYTAMFFDPARGRMCFCDLRKLTKANRGGKNWYYREGRKRVAIALR